MFFVVSCATIIIPPPQAQGSAGGPEGRYVSVRPTVGAPAAAFRIFLTSSETEVIRSMNLELSHTRALPVRRGTPPRFHVEPVARGSALLARQRRVLAELQRVMWALDPAGADWAVHVVVGRTQAYLKSTLRRLGCTPDLSANGGILEMGAALCGRHFLASNLTGYLFLRSPADALTARMESRPEPAEKRTPFLVELRNLSGLAHEWAHIHRIAANNGASLRGEPAWFREGLAEMWAGVAIVNTHRDMTYAGWHAMRLRRFMSWGDRCSSGLGSLRASVAVTNGCEYFLGPLAVELLIARHGGLEKLLELFRSSRDGRDFAADFSGVYGIQLVEFESEADTYIEQIRKAEVSR